MPFDQGPNEGGGGNGGDPSTEVAHLVYAMLISSIIAGQGYRAGEHWTIDMKIGQFVVAAGDYDGLAIPMDALQSAGHNASVLFEALTGRPIGFNLLDRRKRSIH